MKNKKHIIILSILIALVVYLVCSPGRVLALAGPLTGENTSEESLADLGLEDENSAELESESANETEDPIAQEAESSTDDQAEPEHPRIVDLAELFSADEAGAMESLTAEIFAKYESEIIVLTVNDTKGKSSRSFADDFFDTIYPGDKISGCVLLIDMANRKTVLSAKGHLIDVLTDADREKVLQAGNNDMRNGNYGAAVMVMLRRIDYFLSRGVLAGQYRQEAETPPEPNSVSTEDAGLAGLGGLGTGAAYFASQKRRYKGKKRPLQYNLGANQAVNLIAAQDLVIDSRIHAVPLPRHDDNDSNHFGGGGSGNVSTTYTSSSGDTHSSSEMGF